MDKNANKDEFYVIAIIWSLMYILADSAFVLIYMFRFRKEIKQECISYLRIVQYVIIILALGLEAVRLVFELIFVDSVYFFYYLLLFKIINIMNFEFCNQL